MAQIKVNIATGATGTLATANIADDAITAAKIADNAVVTAAINADAVTDAKIADDVIGTEHLTAGEVDATAIADNAITLAKMVGGTDGNIISYDASGDPVAIATGSDGQVLTSTGAGSPPAFEATALAGIDDQTSSNDDQLTITDSEVTINEDSDDLDFRVESNSYTHAFFVDAGADRMGSSASGAPDLGFFHIKSGDSGATVEAHADELVVEGSGNAGISILAGNGSGSIINFGDDGANNVGLLSYDHGGNYMRMQTNADVGTVVRLNSAGTLSTGNETAADANAGGITLDQNAGDGPILTFKSSDVAHGMTDHLETDTYAELKKNDGATGGARWRGFSENETSMFFQCFATNDNTTQSSSAGANFIIDSRKKSGTDAGAHGANANLFCIQNTASTRFIVDEDGDILYDGGSSAYDEYDDAQLVRAITINRTPDAVIQGKFDKFIKYNYEDLKKTKILGHLSPEEEAEGQKPFIKIGALQRLHNGAIWQQYEKHQQLLEAVYDLAKVAVGEDKANAILDKHEVKRLQ